MKIEELMVGDFVENRFYARLTFNQRISRNDFKREDEYFNSLFPIPLTKELIKKNEFPCMFHSYYNEDKKRDEYSIETYIGNVIYGIKYLHELQHALRVCGLGELSNSFNF